MRHPTLCFVINGRQWSGCRVRTRERLGVGADVPRLHRWDGGTEGPGEGAVDRKFVVRANRLDDLVTLGTLTPAAARFLGA